MEPRLREYQLSCINELFSLLNTYNKIAIKLPTGAGKTLTAINIIKDFIKLNKKNIFVVRRKHLVEQAYNSFLKSGLSCSIIMANDKRFNANAELQVCSIDTISKRNFDLKNIDVVHYDEAWDCTSNIYQKFMNSFPEKTIHIGYSGSFGFVGNKGHTFWKKTIEPVTKLDLINQGFLVFPKVFATEIKMNTTTKITGGDYNNKALFQANDDMKVYGNIVNEYLKHGQGKKAFCFAINIEHSKRIALEFNAVGISAIHIDSTHDTKFREDALKAFEFGSVQILVNVGLLGVGTDIPRAEVLICARPTKSTNLWEQMVGRVLRPYKDKKYAIVLDHGGNTMRLGHPINNFPAQLENKNKNSNTEPTLKTYQCPKCFYMYSEDTKKCPNCFQENEQLIRKIKEKKDAELKEYNLLKKVDEYDLFKKKYLIDYQGQNFNALGLKNKINNIFLKAKHWKHKKNSIFFKSWDLTEKKEDLNLVIRFPKWFTDIKKNESLSSTSKSNSENNSGSSELFPKY